MKGNLSAQARARWAYRMVDRCQSPPPKYGSTEWLVLPEDDFRRIAAVVIAAECWARDGDELEPNLAAQVQAEREAFKQTEDAEYVARRDAHRDRWRGLRVVRGAYADTTELLDGGGCSA